MRAAASLMLLVVACRPPAPETASAAAGAPFVSLSRDACLGECPVYRVAAYRDGSVRYEGREYVTRRGRYTGRIGDAEIRELDALFADGSFFALGGAYNHIDWTCFPGAELGYVSPDGHAKVIDHYFGDTSAPLVLAELESSVDRILGVDRWVGDRPLMIPAVAED